MSKKIEGLEFWPKAKFRGRSITIYGPGKSSIIPVPDNEILCDSCNNLITQFPIPVYFGHALCPRCWEQTKKDNPQFNFRFQKIMKSGKEDNKLNPS